jgi:hypothetical protein
MLMVPEQSMLKNLKLVIKINWFDLFLRIQKIYFQVAMRALGFEPKKEEIKKMIADIQKENAGK